MGTARWKGKPGNGGDPHLARGRDPRHRAWRGGRMRESDRAIVLLKPSNVGGGKGPDFWSAFEANEDEVIGDEPDNTG